MASNPQQGPINKNNDKKHKNKPNNDRNGNTSKNPTQSPPQSNTSANTNKILKDVLSNLECVMCLEFLQPPIVMCESGHNICGPCRKSLCLPICPICKGGITDQRNLALEEICSKMGTSCPNKSHGCTFVTASDNIKDHFEECEYRQYFCPLGRVNGNCSWTGNYNQITDHFTKNHKSQFILKIGSQVMFPDFDVQKPDKDMQLISYGKVLFIYHVKIDVKKNVAFWAIQYIGSEKRAQNYKYEFNFYNNKKTKKVTNITEACTSDTMSIEEVFTSGNCIAIPLFSLKNYIHENKKFTFKFFIRSTAPNKLADNMATMKFD